MLEEHNLPGARDKGGQIEYLMTFEQVIECLNLGPYHKGLTDREKQAKLDELLDFGDWVRHPLSTHLGLYFDDITELYMDGVTLVVSCPPEAIPFTDQEIDAWD